MPAPRKTAALNTPTEKALSRRILVLITRDQTDQRQKVIWAHEFPILEAVFGDGNVVQQDAEVLDEGYTAKPSAALTPFNKKQDPIKRPSEVAGLGFVFTGDAEAEYERLAGVYGKHPDVNQPWVENIYGRFSAGTFARVLGLADFEDMPDAQLRSLVLERDYVPILTPDATADERREVEAKRTALLNMPRAELLKLVEEIVGELA